MTGGPPGAVRCRTTDVEGTRALAGALADLCVPGDVVLLVGDLGAGKTAFAQGFGRALGVDEPITSPTFALLRQYPCAPGVLRTLLHADVYRLDHLEEIVDLGLGQLVEDGGVAVVEWGDRAEPVLGAGSLVVRLDPVEDADDARSVTILPIGTAWDDRWRALAAAVASWALTR